MPAVTFDNNMNAPHKKSEDGTWHKLATLILVKLNLKEIELSVDDVEKIQSNTHIVLDERGFRETGTFRIRLVDDATAAQLRAQQTNSYASN